MFCSLQDISFLTLTLLRSYICDKITLSIDIKYLLMCFPVHHETFFLKCLKEKRVMLLDVTILILYMLVILTILIGNMLAMLPSSLVTC